MSDRMDEVWTCMGTPMFYKLDADNRPVPATLREWATAIQKARRTLGWDVVGKQEVSTVFVGLHDGRGPYFETAVFGPDKVDIRGRYTTYDEAMKGHAAVVARLKKDTT